MYLVRHDAQAGTRWYPEGNCWLDNLQEKRWSHGWVPHLTLSQGLLPVRQLAMCLFASHFCRSSDLKCRVVPIHPTPKDFWEQFSWSQHQTTKLLAMSHTVSFERETQLLLRVKSKLYHRQGKDTSFFADEAFSSLVMRDQFFYNLPQTGQEYFLCRSSPENGQAFKKDWRWKPGKILKKIWKSAHIMISLIFEDVPFLWVELFWWFWTMIGSAHHCVVFLLMKLFSWMLCKI